MRFGFLVILVGALFLLRNMGIIVGVEWSILWPIIIMLIGITIVTRAEMDKSWRKGKLMGWGDCGCDCDACNACETRGKRK